jgi:hypothetical protein
MPNTGSGIRQSFYPSSATQRYRLRFDARRVSGTAPVSVQWFFTNYISGSVVNLTNEMQTFEYEFSGPTSGVLVGLRTDNSAGAVVETTKWQLCEVGAKNEYVKTLSAALPSPAASGRIHSDLSPELAAKLSHWWDGDENGGYRYDKVEPETRKASVFGENKWLIASPKPTDNPFPMTVAAWVNPSQLIHGEQGIVNNYAASSQNGFSVHAGYDGAITAWYYLPSGRYCSVSVAPGALKANQRQLVWCEIDDDGLRVYINNQLASSVPWSGSGAISASTSAHGWRIGHYTESIRGRIGDAFVLNSILDNDARDSIWNNGFGLPVQSFTSTQKTDWKAVYGWDGAADVWSGNDLTNNGGVTFEDVTVRGSAHLEEKFANVLSNGGFETLGTGANQPFAGWTLNITGPRCVVSHDTVTVSGSGKSLRMDVADTNYASVNQYALVIGRRYKLKLWAKVSSTSGNPQVWIYSGANYKGNLTSDYSLHEVEFVATSETFTFFPYGDDPSLALTGKTVWFDDLTLEEVSKPVALSNEDFEAGTTTLDQWGQVNGATVETSDVHSGTRCARLPVGAGAHITSPNGFPDAKHYRIEFWAKSVSGTSHLRVGAYSDYPNNFDIAPVWTKYVATYLASGPTPLVIYNQFGASDVLVDDVSVEEYSAEILISPLTNNGGFETAGGDGTAFDYWGESGFGASRDSGDYKSGSHSARVTPGTYIDQQSVLSLNEVHRAQCWIKGTVANCLIEMRHHGTTDVQTATTDWALYQREIKALETTFLIYNRPDSAGDVFVDDVLVTKPKMVIDATTNNGSFDTLAANVNDVASVWIVSPSGGTSTISIDPITKHSGNYAIRAKIDADNNIVDLRSLPGNLVLGREYVLEFWGRFDSGSLPINVQHDTYFVSLNDQWQKITYKFIANHTDLKISTWGNGHNRTYWFDSFNLLPTSIPATTGIAAGEASLQVRKAAKFTGTGHR